MRKLFYSVACATTLFSLGYFTRFVTCRPDLRVPEISIRREIIHDTLVVTLAQPAETIYTGEYLRLPIGRDTVFIEREKRVYRDSLYVAEVSGLDPRLDSLVIFPRHTFEIVASPSVCLSSKRQRWALGVTAGATVTPRGLSPGLTIGLTYSLAAF